MIRWLFLSFLLFLAEATTSYLYVGHLSPRVCGQCVCVCVHHLTGLLRLNELVWKGSSWYSIFHEVKPNKFWSPHPAFCLLHLT